ncbi:glutamine-hydrolyzing carbamoyl-phosphate synthase small subunit [Francisella philomiragia]|uniref:glutamine-hydrolyzing carbamoyl-phosphate synthase small subunit n=1 Tax=Francisella philomiragia TaxID=28110 RepID=UPI0019049519|nr:glutamine-hydrolyzing carbamoyl-phosphate synthase small subunit [Francisella philomiragia]MBK2266971.1 glutamine-hydrolyzing carbamoyl-phosphate synthase small subunit [Francisella philomiragia]MBK2278530.1 glutamine-hydrolyzing carbamoyl-phosphate synthase small subunit [Francisella philomiragia]MBK2286280.1 glutamine-hydrolyzing carbamoyl-phosphate synthase small subunit [Francisella philomiragia]MBK2288361.1 glutamine-hydrolyzing carbamoyl-phosphate synthase small subunit [Francisella ph
MILANDMTNAILVFPDGTYYLGRSIGVRGWTDGEICFNTSMTGYQETLTDPSYAGQIITFTFPHIGNVGINNEDNESLGVFAKGLIVRENLTNPSNFRSKKHIDTWLKNRNIVGICGVDTRAIVRKVRKEGAVRVAILSVKPGEFLDANYVRSRIKNKSNLNGRDLAISVTTNREYDWNEHTFSLGQQVYKQQESYKYSVVVIDYGVKYNILRNLVDAGFKVTVVPADSTYEDIMKHNPDGVFLSNGPGDPFATSDYTMPVIKKLLEIKMPIFGICLGNQLLALAAGLKTKKMHKGHRGVNQPVLDADTKKVLITSQNHGFVVCDDVVPDNIEIHMSSLFDGTVEGLRFKDRPAFAVQYHPESSPGPHDCKYLFNEFAEMIAESKKGN